jgi:hypothetical protein
MLDAFSKLEGKGRAEKAGQAHHDVLASFKEMLTRLASIPVTDIEDEAALDAAFQSAAAAVGAFKKGKSKTALREAIVAARAEAKEKLGELPKQKPIKLPGDPEEEGQGGKPDPKKTQIDSSTLEKAILISKIPQGASDVNWLLKLCGLDLLEKTGLEEVVESNAWWLNTAPGLIAARILRSKTFATSALLHNSLVQGFIEQHVGSEYRIVVNSVIMTTVYGGTYLVGAMTAPAAAVGLGLYGISQLPHFLPEYAAPILVLDAVSDIATGPKKVKLLEALHGLRMIAELYPDQTNAITSTIGSATTRTIEAIKYAYDYGTTAIVGTKKAELDSHSHKEPAVVKGDPVGGLAPRTIPEVCTFLSLFLF